jgi:drug/metabolite transporter (DMT)-like permease
MKPSYAGFLFISLAVAGYSFLPVFIQPLYDANLTPLEIAFWRYSMAAPLLWGLSVIERRRLQTIARRPPAIPLLLMGLLLAVAAMAAFTGLDLLPAGTFVVIFYTYPAMVALIALFMGERLSRWGWVAVALTLVGVSLTAPDFSAGLAGENATGVIFALINAVVVAAYYILSERLLRGVPQIFRSSALTCTGAWLTLGIIAVFSGIRLPPPETIVPFVALSTISTIVPIFALNVGIQKLGSSRAAVVGSFEPLLTAFLAMVFLGQQMEPIQWLGGLVIVVSIILLQTLGRPVLSLATSRASGSAISAASD